MAQTVMDGAPSLSGGMAAAFRELQDEVMLLALPWIYAGGLLLMLQPAHRYPLLTAVPGLILVLVAAAAWFLHRLSRRGAAWVLVAGMYMAGWLLSEGSHPAVALAMVVLATGLMTIILGFARSVAIVAVATLAVFIWPRFSGAGVLEIHWIALVQMWSILLLIWLGSRPLLTAMQWFLASHAQSRDLLQRARDNQLLLNQTLDDLADAHSQLTRLNNLANSMRQLAEEARKTKEQFVANVSHELRTPLNIILGFIEMIMQAPETYGHRVPRALLADLSVVLRNGKHLSDLIDDVLDLSQIESGRMALTKERVCFADIVEAAVLAVGPLYESKRLYLRTEIAPDLPSIYCDQVRIRQVLLNVLSNAGRFTEEGGVQLCAVQEHSNLVVSIADTGPGISNDELEKIFQPFQQGDNSIRRRFGGSGLGLNISKAFVELHDGKMWIESREGHGLTVYFSLPLTVSTPPFGGALRWISPYAEYFPRDRPSLAPVPVNRPRLVVMETGASFERLLTRYLANVEIVHTATLSAALEEATRIPTQALLVNDLALGPRPATSDGLAQLPTGTPVIYCSVPGPQESAKLLGVNDYLIKPVARESLLVAMQRSAPAASTVLLVDDDPDALLLFRRILASSGRDYRVIRAESGQQAIQILAEQNPDLILLDLLMPEMDGFQFLAEKNANPNLRAIPVVVISAQDPMGEPIVSRTVSVTHSGGISTRQLLGLIEASVHLLSAQQTHLGLQRGEEVEPADGFAEETARTQS